MPVLELRNVIEHFGASHALDGVDLPLDAGEVLGRLGAKNVASIAVAVGMANALEGAKAGGIPDFLPDAHRSIAAKHKHKVTPGKKNGKAAPKNLTSTQSEDHHVARLKHATCNVRLVERGRPKPIHRGELVAEGGEERERKLCGVKWSRRERRYSFFDLTRVHTLAAATMSTRSNRLAQSVQSRF